MTRRVLRQHLVDLQAKMTRRSRLIVFYRSFSNAAKDLGTKQNGCSNIPSFHRGHLAGSFRVYLQLKEGQDIQSQATVTGGVVVCGNPLELKPNEKSRKA